MRLCFYTREPTKPHLTVGGGTQVMGMDEGSLVLALIVYQACLNDVFDVDPCDDTIDRGPKPIEELVKLQLGPKPEQCTQLSRDLTIHEHKRIVDVLHKNMNLFAWKPSNMPGIHPSIICRKLTIYP